MFLDTSGHGTHVAGIAAGNEGQQRTLWSCISKRANYSGRFLSRSIISNSDSINGGIDFVLEVQLNTICLLLLTCFGNHYSAHNGSSI